MKGSRRRPPSTELDRKTIVHSSSQSTHSSSEVSLKSHGLLSKVASFRTLRKKSKDTKAASDSSAGGKAKKKGQKGSQGENGASYNGEADALNVSIAPSPPSAGHTNPSPRTTTPSSGLFGSIGRSQGRSFFDRGSPVSSSVPIITSSSASPSPSPPSFSTLNSNEGVPARVLPKDVRGDINKFQLEGYARKYFGSRKKGIFKRQVPLQELLTFQRKDMTAPLLDLKNKPELCATAIRMFQLIITYQGLKKPLKPADEISTARELLQEALREGQIRDEIYCQVCKQTCNTPSTDVLYKGWELMTLCCVTFPPTRNFEEWLRKHLWEHTKRSDQREAAFATYCVRKLDLICEAPPSVRVPSNYEIEKIREAPFCGSPFGITLQEIVDLQKEKGVDDEIPEIMTRLCEGIIRLNGLSTLGIFRVKGDPKRTYELKVDLECCNYTLETVNPHDLANLLKVWLRELAEPLIPFELQCLAAADNIREALQVVNKLPPLNKLAMGYLVNFLRRFLTPEVEAKTKMNASSIAAIFAPNLLRAPDNQISLENSRLEQDFVKTLLVHWRG